MQRQLITKTARAALQRLSRPGAVLRAHPRGGFCVATGGDARRRPSARVSAPEMRAMASEGLIEADKTGAQCWRIAEAGRAYLQRQESASKALTDAALPSDFTPQSPALRRLRALSNAAGGAWFSAAELRAGERFERDHRLSLLGARVMADWSAPPMDRGRRQASGAGGGPDCAIEARTRLAAIRQAFGANYLALLADIFGDELGLEEIERRRAWPPRSGKVVLKMALSMLADFYPKAGSDVRAA
ncbi:MAG: DUF6456 domain-containing protein [Caulobacterales bacterium]